MRTILVGTRRGRVVVTMANQENRVKAMRQTTIFMENDEFADTDIGDAQDAADVEVSLTLRDLQEAALDNVITDLQASKLWQRFAPRARAALPPTYDQSDAPDFQDTQTEAVARGPRFGFVNVLYYFGGLLAIGAMSLFMTLGFQALGAAGLLAIGTAYLIACLKVADYFKTRALNIPAGILATLAITLVPLVVWCLQSLLGLWPPGASHRYSDYHLFVNWRWTTLEFATLAAAVVMLWRYKLPFMVMPVAMTVWYMSMDVAHALMQNEGFDWKFARDVSVVFGLATMALAVWVDIRTRRSRDLAWRQDFAFWLYLLGTVMFWGGLSLRDSESEWGKLLYAALNVALIFGGAVIRRRVLTVFGAFGVAGYLGYLSHRVFQDSLLFPFALTFLGLAVVGLGVWWQRNEAAIERRMNAFVPQGLRQPR
jgi:MFS family permease